MKKLSDLLINFARKLRRARRQARTASRWKPAVIHPDDIFIVSYPKSGNTWVRFLIANLLKQPGEEIDFYTSLKYIPGLVKNADAIGRLERPRLMKSHAPYLPDYPSVIYVLRDGRDVYVSYYFHLLQTLPEGTTFREFLGRERHTPSSWGDHVASWLFREQEGPQRTMVVRYEDLQHDCLVELSRIAEFIGLETTQAELRQAIAASSFENMRSLELEKGRPYKHEGPEVFMREGRSGGWRAFFGAEEKAIFKAREGRFLVRLGYEQDDNW